MMEQLALRDGQRAVLKSVNLSLGKFLKIQPQEVAFLDLSNPRVVYGAVPARNRGREHRLTLFGPAAPVRRLAETGWSARCAALRA